jgi:hypothetical protein
MSGLFCTELKFSVFGVTKYRPWGIFLSPVIHLPVSNSFIEPASEKIAEKVASPSPNAGAFHSELFSDCPPFPLPITLGRHGQRGGLDPPQALASVLPEGGSPRAGARREAPKKFLTLFSIDFP